MSSLSTMLVRERIIYGIGLRIRPDADLARTRGGGGTACRRACLSAGQLLSEMLLELGREFLRVRIPKIPDLGVAAVLQRRIQVRDDGAQA